MKNNKLKLDHVNFTVNDFNATVKWYKRVFDFDLVESGVSEEGLKWGILKNGESLLAITEDKKKRNYFGTDIHRMNHFGFRLENESEWVQQMDRHELQTYFGSPVKYPHSTSWYVKDPTGNNIEVSVWKGNQLIF